MSQKLVLITPVAPPASDPSKPAAAPAPFLAVISSFEPGAVDPGWGVRPPVDPGYGIPELPGVGGGHPDQGLPGGRPPHVGNWVPGAGVPHPSHPIYHPDKPTPPGEGEPEKPEIWPPIDAPGGGAPGYILVWVPGYGYRWIHIGARPDHTLPGGAPARPDQSLPPGAQPKK